MQNQNSTPTWITRVKKLATGWWSMLSVKFLEREIWLMRLNALLGICLTLLGFAIDSRNPVLAYVFKGCGIAYTIKIVLAFYKQAANRKKEETASAQLWKKRTGEVKDVVVSELRTFSRDLHDNIMQSLEIAIQGAAEIRRSGIVRIFRGLDLEKILKGCFNTTVLLQRLYFSQKEFKTVMDQLYDLIVHKGCQVKVLLLSPAEEEFLRKRRRSCSVYQKLLNHGVEQLVNTIRLQLLTLDAFKQGLPIGKRDHLQVQVHADHAIGPVTAFDQTIIASLYLNEEMSEDGFQLEIEGAHTYAHQIWMATFNIQWLHSWRYNSGIDEDTDPLSPVPADITPDPPPVKDHGRIGKVLTLSECMDKTA